MEDIRDRLSVGEQMFAPWDASKYAVWYYENDWSPRKVASFPTEDDAWGVVSLILEYVEQYGYDEERAVAQALIEYHEAIGEALACAMYREPTLAELCRQDHAHAMACLTA